MGMGAHGPAPEEGSVRDQQREAAGQIIRVDAGQLVAPPPLAAWRPGTAAAWQRWWESDIALKLLSAVDIPAVARLFSYYDMMDRMWEEWNALVAKAETMEGATALVSPGSRGQETTSAYLDSLQKLEQMVLRLEERFGITPLVRMKLGIKIAEAVEATEPGKAGKVKRQHRGEG